MYLLSLLNSPETPSILSVIPLSLWIILLLLTGMLNAQQRQKGRQPRLECEATGGACSAGRDRDQGKLIVEERNRISNSSYKDKSLFAHIYTLQNLPYYPPVLFSASK